MSTYKASTQHPFTGEWEMATWLDDHYGPHKYGVRFPNGDTFDPREHELKTMGFDERMNEAYTEWYQKHKPEDPTWPGDKFSKEAYEELGRLYQVLRESYNF